MTLSALARESLRIIRRATTRPKGRLCSAISSRRFSDDDDGSVMGGCGLSSSSSDAMMASCCCCRSRYYSSSSSAHHHQRWSSPLVLTPTLADHLYHHRCFVSTFSSSDGSGGPEQHQEKKEEEEDFDSDDSTTTTLLPLPVLLERTSRFLRIPIGSLSNRDLHQASELVKGWVETSTTNSFSSSTTTSRATAVVESIDQCFQIMDRVMNDIAPSTSSSKGRGEATDTSSSNNVINHQNYYMLNTFHSMLIILVEHWKRVWENPKQSNVWTANVVQDRLILWSTITNGRFVPSVAVMNLILQSYWNVKQQPQDDDDDNSSSYTTAAIGLEKHFFVVTTTTQKENENRNTYRLVVSSPPPTEEDDNGVNTNDQPPTPNQRTYRILLNAWLEAKDIEKSIQIINIILELPSCSTTTEEQENEQEQEEEVERSQNVQEEDDDEMIKLFDKALELCASKGDGESADRILQYMLDFHHHDKKKNDNVKRDLPPNTMIHHYNHVIEAWANAKDKERSIQRVQDILSFLIEGDPSSSHHHLHLQPNIQTFNGILRTYSQLNQIDEAEHLLVELCNDYQKNVKEKKEEEEDASTATTTATAIRPDRESFAIVLDGWAQSKHREAGSRAEALLRKQWNLHYSSTSTTSTQSEQAYLIPDCTCYTAVMESYVNAKHPNAGKHAERIFQGMLVQSERGHPASVKLDATHKTFHTLIRAWTISGDVDQAGKVLDIMYKLYCEHPAKSPPPNVDCYNTLIKAYAESHNVIAGKETRRLLDHMWELVEHDHEHDPLLAKVIQPNEETYRNCIQAWAQSGHADAGKEAERLLQEMIERADQLHKDDSSSLSSLKPTTRTYNAVLDAWTKCDDYWQAKKVFSIIPSHLRDVETYNWLLDVLAWSPDVQLQQSKGEIADSILTAMAIRGVPPNQSTNELAYQCWHHHRNHHLHDSSTTTLQESNQKANYRMRILEMKMDSTATAAKDGEV